MEQDEGPKRRRRARPSTPAGVEPLAEEGAPQKRKRGDKSFLRAAHGRAVEHGNPGPRVEVPPADEISSPLPQIPTDAEVPRHVGGPFAKGNRIAALGGRAKGGSVAYASSLGIPKELIEVAPPELKRALRKAATYRVRQTGELAKLAGGECGMAASLLIANAALNTAASRYVFVLAMMETDTDKLIKLFSIFARLTAENRQNVLAGREVAIRDGEKRLEGDLPVDPLAAGRKRLAEGQPDVVEGMGEPVEDVAPGDGSAL